jgi:hypothetical protein
MRLTAIAIGVLVSLVAAASGGRPSADAAIDPDWGCSAGARSTSCSQRLQALDTELRGKIGAASCTENAQCRTLPIGAKLCGGPLSFLAYSAQGTNEAELQKLSAELNRLHRLTAEARSRAGMVSDCMVIDDPGAECRGGKCELRRQR